MTIEEARNTIKSLKQYYNDKNEDTYVGFDNEDNEALDMASRALEVVQGMEEVFIQELTELDMRDVPEEERNSLWHYIDSISQSTGVKIELEPCEDCISREAVRRILANQRDELVKLHTVNPKDNPKADAMAYGVNWSLNTLMELSPVKPQRPKGKWIPLDGDLKKCSVCGEYSLCTSKFCCSCGAEMEEDK